MGEKVKFKNNSFSIKQNLSFYWSQNNTGGVSFENMLFCIDDNHYITQPKGEICDICNCLIENRQ